VWFIVKGRVILKPFLVVPFSAGAGGENERFGCWISPHSKRFNTRCVVRGSLAFKCEGEAKERVQKPNQRDEPETVIYITRIKGFCA
jgi:hypothetical protein